MIKERYVNLEVAKLLRDKGFDEECTKLYNINNGLVFEGDEACNSELTEISELITRPTQAVACDWIEEKYNISIELWTGLFGYEMSVRYAKKNFTLTGEIINKEDMPFGDNSDGSWSNKEQAYNDMIKYVLINLI